VPCISGYGIMPAHIKANEATVTKRDLVERAIFFKTLYLFLSYVVLW